MPKAFWRGRFLPPFAPDGTRVTRNQLPRHPPGAPTLGYVSPKERAAADRTGT